MTRHALELMDAFGFGASMLTKSPLILRDTDLYQEISTHSPVLCMMTITTADDGLSKKIEPGVPASSERFAAVRAMADQGLYTGVVMTPLLPFLEDTEQNIREMVKRTADTGARFLYGIMGVTIRDGQREYFYDALTKRFPGERLAERYAAAYGNRYSCASPRARKLWETFTEECQREGLLWDMKDIIHDYKKKYACTQLEFQF